MTLRAFLIVVIPLLSFATIILFGRLSRLRGICDRIAIAAIAISFILSYGIYRQAMSAYDMGEPFLHLTAAPFEWLTFDHPEAAGQQVSWKIGFWVDSMTAMMLMVVTIVSLLVHIFSLGYMKGEENYNRFFAYLSLFSFSMLLLVLTDNLIILYCCWELVGISSFLLIGFYVNRESAAAAAKKAFVTNRVGDLGFAIGLFLIYSHFHTFSFREVFERVQAGEMSSLKLTITSLFRCTSGSPMRWKARHRSARSSTPRRWWPRVCIWWRASTRFSLPTHCWWWPTSGLSPHSWLRPLR
ncbi:MAG: hypothetical protein IPI28_01105 [Candidatus Omnitrophica bacterium]|nr:hypothetical protein [Candidatus Omnitrophota bacterium]